MADAGLILIPAHNESDSIINVIQNIRLYAPDIPIVVIDSQSSDDTAAKAKTTGVMVISGPLGYWPALCVGYQYALAQNVDWIVQLDGDGQHPPIGIPKMLIHGSKGDWIIGSRWNTGCEISTSRWLAQKCLQQWVYQLSNVWLSDISSGFWLLKRKTMQQFLQYQGKTGDAALRYFALRQGISIVEVPMCMAERKTGQSMHSGLSSNLRYFRQVGKDLFHLSLR